MRDYLKHFLLGADSPREFEPYINDVYLRHVFAEVKIENGLGDAEQWASQLPKWRRHPATAALFLGAPAALAVVMFSRRIPAPPPAVAGLALGIGVVLTLSWWALTRPRPAAALAAGAAALLVGGFESGLDATRAEFRALRGARRPALGRRPDRRRACRLLRCLVPLAVALSSWASS